MENALKKESNVIHVRSDTRKINERHAKHAESYETPPERFKIKSTNDVSGEVTTIVAERMDTTQRLEKSRVVEGPFQSNIKMLTDWPCYQLSRKQ
jgi:hypothetical protein